MRRLFVTLISMLLAIGSMSAQEASSPKQRRAQRLASRAVELINGGKPDRGVVLLRRAANMGYAFAQYNLGMCCYKALGVDADLEETVKWWRMAAVQGHVEAQYLMAVCYARGYGVEVDMMKAAMWALKSAEQGYAEAQYIVGMNYLFGYGVAMDYDKGVMWLRRSARQGVVDAQSVLVELGESW